MRVGEEHSRAGIESELNVARGCGVEGGRGGTAAPRLAGEWLDGSEEVQEIARELVLVSVEEARHAADLCDRFSSDPQLLGGGAVASVVIDLLRRVNTHLDQRLVQPRYGRVAKQYFTHGLLSQHSSPAPKVPADLLEHLAPMAQRWMDEIVAGGYHLYGDPAALFPAPAHEAGSHPDDVDAATEVETADAVIAELLLEIDRLQSRAVELKSDVKTLKKKRRSLKLRLAEALNGTG